MRSDIIRIERKRKDEKVKIGIVSNKSPQSTELYKKLLFLLKQHAFELNQLVPDIVISVGGDGTLLSAFHKYSHRLDQTRFIGVHTGHLGFYTDWREYELEELVSSLLRDQGESVSYPLLETTIVCKNKEKKMLALNESAIKIIDGTLVCDVFIKEEYFESFRGDGLCISTPTGSTGYNKSIGGAVIHPRLEALQMAEMASLNNRVFRTLSSPMIIAPDEWIVLKPRPAETYLVTVDHLSFWENDIKEMKFKIADERIHFARYKHTHFWSRVGDAFLGK